MSKIMTNFRAEDMPGRAKKPEVKPAPTVEVVAPEETAKAETKRSTGGGFKTEIAVE